MAPDVLAQNYKAARRTAARCNKLALDGQLQQSVRCFLTIKKFLSGTSPRSLRGWWKVRYRIVILYLRMGSHRAARAMLEKLWRQAPKPVEANQAKLRKLFKSLRGKLQPEVRVRFHPSHVRLVVRDSSGSGKLLPTRSSKGPKGAPERWYDVKAGPVDIIASAVGYRTLQFRLIAQPVRSVLVPITLTSLPAEAQASSYYNEGLRLERRNNFARAYSMYRHSLQLLKKDKTLSSENRDLLWKVSLRLGVALTFLNRDDEARTYFRGLWAQKLSDSQRRQLRQRLCRLGQQRGWRLPELEKFAACEPGEKASSSEKNGAPPDARTTAHATSSNSPSIFSWVLWGAGAAALVAGGVFFGLAEAVRMERDDRNVPTSRAAELDEIYKGHLNVTYGLLIGGGVFAVAGLVTYLALDRRRKNTTPSSQTKTSASGKKIILFGDFWPSVGGYPPS